MPAPKQKAKPRRFIKSSAKGGRAITSLEQLVAAVISHFGYDRSSASPFPSQEAPPVAIRKWYEQRLQLKVLGKNRFAWICPGCNEPVEAETNYLHTCLMFDYDYWEFCPRCGAKDS